MTRQYLTFLFTLLVSATSYAQSNKASCNCHQTEYISNIKADTTFYLSNGKAIILCGDRDSDWKQSRISYFILSVCGQDTIIDFWGGMLTSFRLKANKDTLLVEDLKILNTGEKDKYQEIVWTTEKIYFNGPEVIRKLTLNRQIKKYSQAKIKAVLISYENAKPMLDDMWDIVSNLFMAAISGDKTARRYFTEFENHFVMPDGDVGEGYGDLTEMLAQWESKEELPVKRRFW